MNKKGILQMEVGTPVETYLLIQSSTKGIASNGKPFLTLFLGDSTGEIEAKLWDISEEDERNYQPNTIVRVSGEVQSYRGKHQLKIKTIRVVNETDTITIADLLERAPLSKEEMQERIQEYIFEMTNPNIQRITRFLLSKHQNAFFEYPAASKNHHEYVGGLAYHVVTMLSIAKSLVAIYPSLNRDLLYAGIILHDMGKVIELTGPINRNYTVEGNLIGHISIMTNEIAKAASELHIAGEEVFVLQHIVLSHHGQPEWGSPKVPMIREAEIIHFIDNIDARLQMIDRSLARVKPGEFSERIFPLENRNFYKPSFDDQNTEAKGK